MFPAHHMAIDSKQHFQPSVVCICVLNSFGSFVSTVWFVMYGTMWYASLDCSWCIRYFSNAFFFQLLTYFSNLCFPSLSSFSNSLYVWRPPGEGKFRPLFDLTGSNKRPWMLPKTIKCVSMTRSWSFGSRYSWTLYPSVEVKDFSVGLYS